MKKILALTQGLPCDSAKAAVTRNFITLNANIRKEERLEIKYVVLQFKKLET